MKGRIAKWVIRSVFAWGASKAMQAYQRKRAGQPGGHPGGGARPAGDTPSTPRTTGDGDP